MSEETKDITLPILYSEGRQLQLVKDGKLVASYDPVYELTIDGNELTITGANYIYKHNTNEFDDIIVEEFDLDENGDRIFIKPYFTY